jgi:type I restriction enzyme R subunit
MVSERRREQVKQLLLETGWNSEGILEEQALYFRGKVMHVDIVLLYHLYPLAAIELKGLGVSLEPTTDQVLQHAKAVDVPFAFVTDGAKVFGISAHEGRRRTYARFLTPSELWSALGREWDENDPRLFPPFRDPKMSMRVHHALAVSRTVEAVIDGNKRILISMPQGSGKTFVAFQIAWKLMQSGHCQRLLYLSNRRALISFAEHRFKPFGESLLLLTRTANHEASHRVHLGTTDHFVRPRRAPTFRELPPELYDLILVPDADPIEPMIPVLEHFQEAMIIGFTSREPPSSEVTEFYGQPSFTYSLEEVLAIRASS